MVVGWTWWSSFFYFSLWLSPHPRESDRKSRKTWCHISSLSFLLPHILQQLHQLCLEGTWTCHRCWLRFMKVVILVAGVRLLYLVLAALLWWCAITDTFVNHMWGKPLEKLMYKLKSKACHIYPVFLLIWILLYTDDLSLYNLCVEELHFPSLHYENLCISLVLQFFNNLDFICTLAWWVDEKLKWFWKYSGLKGYR